jgi:AraC-like DNA-binding protein
MNHNTDPTDGAGPLRLALSYAEAAQALGISERHFHRHVSPRLRVTLSGGRRLVSIRELERYLDERAV